MISSDNLSILKNQFRQFKVMLLGESGVGKSSLLNRYIYQKFDYGIPSTAGIDYLYQTKVINNKKIKL